MNDLRIDHVILGVRAVSSGAARLEQRTGLVSVPGGRHDGHGTGNRIVPLGEQYLEVMGVVDAAEAGSSPMGRWVTASVAERDDRWLAVCLATDDLDSVAERLGLTPVAMSRRRHDGVLLQWRLAGLEAAYGPERLPFFIEWAVEEDEHPGRLDVEQPLGPVSVSWIEIGGDPVRLEAWCGGAELPIRARLGEPGLRSVGLATCNGTLVLS